MSFLAPLFLLGALAVALPVVFHLVRRTTRERTPFSSLMFLRPAPPRLTRRNRLEHLLLLCLRCAAIGLLAFGFARPLLRHALPESGAGAAARHFVVLLDRSASMQRGKLWSAGREQAEAILRRASPRDQAALFTFDRQLTPLISFEEWKALAPGDRAGVARQRLAEARPGWAGTHLDQVLIRAADLLAEVDPGQVPGPRQVVLITDLQSGSRLSALQGFEWPKGIELVVERVAVRDSNNAGLHWVPDSSEAPTSAESAARIRIRNEPDATREQFQVGWARADSTYVSNALDIHVPIGQSRVVTLPAPGTNSGAERIVLRGDDEAFDNSVYLAPPEPVRVNVLYLGGEAETDTRQPLYFLRRALQETRRQTVQVVARPPAAAPTAAELEAANLLLATDNLPPAQARALHDQVANGKTLLFAPRGANAAPAIAAVLGMGDLPLEEVGGSGYAMLSEIDFRHPLFAPFADARFSDFTKIHFWKRRRLDPAPIAGAKVLARFDTGDAALVEAPVGKGRVLLLASGWHPEDSQLGLSSKFVPLLYSLLELSGAAPPTPARLVVGDPLPLPTETAPAALPGEVVNPDGTRRSLLAQATNPVETFVPGIYRISTGPGTRALAVNLDPAESQTTPLPLDELERLGAPVKQPLVATAAAAARKVELQNAELESRQKLWRWFIVATLAVLIVETWLAGRTARLAALPALPGEARP